MKKIKPRILSVGLIFILTIWIMKVRMVINDNFMNKRIQIRLNKELYQAVFYNFY